MSHLVSTPTNQGKEGKVFLQYDNLDDRREIALLVAQLSPVQRVSFMHWFLSNAQLGPWSALRPTVSEKTIQLAQRAMNDAGADERHRIETVLDIWAAASIYSGLNLTMAFNRLVEMVRRRK